MRSLARIASLSNIKSETALKVVLLAMYDCASLPAQATAADSVFDGDSLELLRMLISHVQNTGFHAAFVTDATPLIVDTMIRGTVPHAVPLAAIGRVLCQLRNKDVIAGATACPLPRPDAPVMPLKSRLSAWLAGSGGGDDAASSESSGSWIVSAMRSAAMALFSRISDTDAIAAAETHKDITATSFCRLLALFPSSTGVVTAIEPLVATLSVRYEACLRVCMLCLRTVAAAARCCQP